MATDNEATSTGPNPQDRMAKARAAKQAKAQQPDVSAVLAAMQAQIASLTSQLADQKADSNPNLIPVPQATDKLRPGTYVVVGLDANGKDVYGKVRWTREWVDKTYVPLTFTPNRSMDIAPHGIPYRVNAETEITVPSIVKDIYDGVLKGERDHAARYRPLSAVEASEVDARAAAEPGTKQWSRVTRVGFGLNIPDVAEAATDAPTV